MSKSIPIEQSPSNNVEIDATIIAAGLDLAVARFRKLMEQGKVSVLCERGTGDEAGLYRASFYHAGKRVRLVVDSDGNAVEG